MSFHPSQVKNKIPLELLKVNNKLKKNKSNQAINKNIER